MFNSPEKSKNEQKSEDKRTKSSFLENIAFLYRIQKAIRGYNAFSEAQRRFFDDIHIFIEVDNHDITKENEKAIDKQSNTGSRHHGANKSRRTN